MNKVSRTWCVLTAVIWIAPTGAGSNESTAAATEPEAAMTTTSLYQEALRPQFHFTAARNWLNDPNGLVYHRGEYHLFFQHNPRAREWGNMTWGHAVSTDLLHWRQLPNAIEPDAEGTIFSGSAVVDTLNTGGFGQGAGQAIVAIFTVARPGSGGIKEPFVQGIASSTDCGRTWTRYAGNPVIPLVAEGNRDPKVVWHGPSGKWVMTLYLKDDQYAFFSSPDLKAWRHLHDICVPGASECPDFFEMPLRGGDGGSKWVWTAADGRYLVGHFDGERFTRETELLQVEYGANCYAVQTFSDIPPSDGRRIQMAWMRDGKYPGMPFNQQMSFPCELQLHSTPSGPRLTKLPVREVESLHGPGCRWRDLPLRPGANALQALWGDQWHIRAEIGVGDAAQVGFRIRGEAAVYDAKEKTLSCLGRGAPMAPESGRIRIEILVDRASIEVFGNGGKVALTSCFVPSAGNDGLEVFATGASARLVSMEAYPVRSVWQ
jgi:fructan beta-fructosidase